MLGLLLMILVFSAIVAVMIKVIFPSKINFTEMFASFGISFVFGGLFLFGLSFASTSDFDIINGKVTSKEMDRVHCRHSYSCHCRTVRSGKSSYTHCDTCYLHSFDQDWNVNTTVGDYRISTVDSQGLIEPQRWSIVKPGDPASASEYVTNYVLASPDSLFNIKSFTKDSQLYGKYLPEYPSVYDYYKFNHAINKGVTGLNINSYNQSLAQKLTTLGAAKQVNIVMVFVPITDRNYISALERHWVGSKKNDVVIAVGVKNYPKIDWADAFSFGKSSGNGLLLINLRDDIQAIGDVTKVNEITNSIAVNVSKNYHRVSMEKFKYLREDYFPSAMALTIGGILYTLILLGLTILFYKIDFDLSSYFTKRSNNSFNNRYRRY